MANQLTEAEWTASTRAREMPSKHFAKALILKMMEVRPPPPFALHPHIVSFVFDQTYAAKGRKSGAGSTYTNPVRRVDEKGETISKQRVVYINSFDLAVDARECCLSPAAVKVIAERGPYTQDFARILPILDPQVSLWIRLALIIYAYMPYTHMITNGYHICLIVYMRAHVIINRHATLLWATCSKDWRLGYRALKNKGA